MDYTQLDDGTWQRKPRADERPEPVCAWYMRDNHTFRQLPLDVDEALAVMRQERDDGQTYGMLCGRPSGVVPGPVHAGSAAEWSTFEGAARPWLEKAVALSKPPGAEIVRLREDSELLAWVVEHPETCAECLQDAAAGDGTARENLELRRAGLRPASMAASDL